MESIKEKVQQMITDVIVLCPVSEYHSAMNALRTFVEIAYGVTRNEFDNYLLEIL